MTTYAILKPKTYKSILISTSLHNAYQQVFFESDFLCKMGITGFALSITTSRNFQFQCKFDDKWKFLFFFQDQLTKLAQDSQTCENCNFSTTSIIVFLCINAFLMIVIFLWAIRGACTGKWNLMRLRDIRKCIQDIILIKL